MAFSHFSSHFDFHVAGARDSGSRTGSCGGDDLAVTRSGGGVIGIERGATAVTRGGGGDIGIERGATAVTRRLLPGRLDGSIGMGIKRGGMASVSERDPPSLPDSSSLSVI